jgi:hypothetical protein
VFSLFTFWVKLIHRYCVLMSKVAKYKLQDPGVVPGSPPATRRFRVPPLSSASASTPVSGISPNLGPPTTNIGSFGTEHDARTSRIPVPLTQSRARETPNSPGFGYSAGESTVKSRPGRIVTGSPKLVPAGRGTGIPIATHGISAPSPHPSPPFTSNRPGPIITTTAELGFTSDPSNDCIPDTPVSTCATVAPAPSAVELNRTESTSNHSATSTYSSASALARYRAQRYSSACSSDHISLPSRCSSTSSFSSASSLARHRRVDSRARSRHTSSSSTSRTSSQELEAEPDGEVTLVWEPDPESLELRSDPAEDLWREIEARLNERYRSFNGGKGRREGERDERGQWVLIQTERKARLKDRGGILDLEHGQADLEEASVHNPCSKGMEKQTSEFTISAYFDPDLSTPRPWSTSPSMTGSSSSTSDSSGIPFPSSFSMSSMGMGMGMSTGMDSTALFDMSAPLTLSRSIDGATPANTPCLMSETIHRAPRVTKGLSSGSTSGSGSRGRMSRMRSDSTDAVVAQNQDLDLDLCRMSRRSSNNVNTTVSAGYEERQSSNEPYSSPRPEVELHPRYSSSSSLRSHPQVRDTSPPQPFGPDIPVQPLEYEGDTTELEPSDRERREPQSGNRQGSIAIEEARVPTSQARSKLRSEGGLHRLDSQVVAARQSLSRYRDRQYDIEPEVDPQLAAFDRNMLEIEDNTPRMTIHDSPVREYDQDGEGEEQGLRPDEAGLGLDHTPRPYFGLEHHGRAQPPNESTEEQADDEEEEDEVEHEEGLQSSVEFERLQFPTPQIREEGLGLGVGMTIRSDSIYSLSTPFSGINDPPFPAGQSDTTSWPVLSSESDIPYTDLYPETGSSDANEERSPCSIYNAQEQEGEQGMSYPTHVVKDRDEMQDWTQVEEEEEMLCVTDLDTGYRVELPIKQLDELWSL